MTPGRELILIPVAILVVSLVGCAKRPAMVAKGVPAPSTAAVPATPGAAPTGAAGAGAPTAPGAATPGGPPSVRPPAPKEFLSAPDLREIHFDFDRYNIRPGDAKILDENVKRMKAHPNSLILIEGHCDERGTGEYNLALGDRRAKATMNYLVAQGVQASRITIISYGEERPLCREQPCWAKNRRAHFLVKE